MLQLSCIILHNNTNNSLLNTYNRSETFKDFISHCLVKEPENRYTTDEALEVYNTYCTILVVIIHSFSFFHSIHL